MKKKKFKLPEKKKLVHIEWGDAWSAGHWQSVGFEKEEQKPMIVNTIGWVIQANEHGITVAGRIAEDGAPGNVSFVPIGMVMSCTTLSQGSLVNKGK